MPDGTVRASGLNLRGPLTMGEVIKVLRKSSRVEILGEETWLRVKTRDGLEGFVFGDFIERDEAPPAPAVATVAFSGSLTLAQFQHERFIGAPITADVEFFPLLDRIAGFAADAGLFVHVTSSLRDPGGTVQGAIVTPARRSNHFVGHAFDMNLRSASGEFFNSSKLKNLDGQPDSVRQFIASLRDDPDLRWGGDFSTPDVVHVDDGLNQSHPDLWEAKLAARS
ncbi:MAG: M15 family metallopeptidase [Acidobacteriota bacterium]|nr:M15 family metallopeptidase [Acidobacteriota bacterium]MDH3525634.1 M15 family metallopeptidase [Acidobacteriota bacterium]